MTQERSRKLYAPVSDLVTPAGGATRVISGEFGVSSGDSANEVLGSDYNSFDAVFLFCISDYRDGSVIDGISIGAVDLDNGEVGQARSLYLARSTTDTIAAMGIENAEVVALLNSGGSYVLTLRVDDPVEGAVLELEINTNNLGAGDGTDIAWYLHLNES